MTECWPLIGWGRGYDLSVTWLRNVNPLTTPISVERILQTTTSATLYTSCWPRVSYRSYDLYLNVQFELSPVSTTRVDGFHYPLTGNRNRSLGPSTRVVETGLYSLSTNTSVCRPARYHSEFVSCLMVTLT